MIENIIATGFDEIQVFSVNCTLLEIIQMQNKSFGKNILHGISTRLGKIFNNPYRRVNLNRFRLIYYKHLTPGKLRVHRLFGKDLYFLSSTELLHGFKEIFLDEIYKQELPTMPFIIDCGANIGLSVIYMKSLYPDAEIIAFEPDEKNFELLEKNIRAFGFTGVTLRKEAVWIEEGIMSFSSRGSTNSKLIKNQSGKSVSVNAVSLRNLINRKVDFLKIDIEGAEYEVIKSIQDQLHFVHNLFVEYHGNFNENDQLNETLSSLSKNGFSYYIKEALSVFETPFYRSENSEILYDIQLNIFCFRNN